MKKITEIYNLKSARNAEHYNLQEAFLKAASNEFAAKYKLNELRADFASLFAKEDEIYLQSQAFADTNDLSVADAKRDRLFRLIKLTVESKELSLTDAEANAAAKVAFGMKPYKAAANKPDAENTAMVNDLVKKLQSDDYSGYIETLGLTQAVEELKKANGEFSTLYSHRADEKRVRTVTENLLQIRPQVDESAKKLFEGINAVYLVSEVIEKDQTKMQEVGAVIDAVNAEIVQFAETLSRRGIGKKAKVEPDDKPVTPPEEGGSGSGGGGDRPEIE